MLFSAGDTHNDKTTLMGSSNKNEKRKTNTFWKLGEKRILNTFSFYIKINAVCEAAETGSPRFISGAFYTVWCLLKHHMTTYGVFPCQRHTRNNHGFGRPMGGR